MTPNDESAIRHFLPAYQHQYDLNSYARRNYDEDLEYYTSYRPSTRYPLAYSESFNKLLPKIMTILSRFMDQLYQAGTGDLISVRPRKRQDVERAPRVQGLLNQQLENLNDIDSHGGSYLFNFQWMFNALTFGKGIAKVYWRKEQRIAPKRQYIPIPQFDRMGRIIGVQAKSKVVNQMQMIYDGPYAEIIHNKLFVPHPMYRDIQKMPFVFCVYQKSVDHLQRLQQKGIYRNVNEIGWPSGGSPGSGASDTSAGHDTVEKFVKSIEIEGANYYEESDSERQAPMVDIIEGYGKYIFPEDEAPYEIGSGIKIKGPETEAIVHIGNYKEILSLQKNTYGIRPFFDIGAYYHPEMYWDIGLVRLGKGIQEQYNNLGNLRMQNAMMLVNQMIKVRRDADIPPEALIWKPFGLIPVDDMTDVEPIVTPDAFQSNVFREQEQFFTETLDDMLGMYKYGQGGTPDRQEHVGTIRSLQSLGEARTKLLMMTMDHTGFRPLLKHMMRLNLFHLSDGIESRINTAQGQGFTPLFPGDLHMEYDFSARYTGMEPALGKQYRAQQLLVLAQTWQQSPYLQHHQFMKAIMELMDFQDTDKYVKSPQQLQQEQQQMMKQQMMMENMKSENKMKEGFVKEIARK